MTTSTTPAIKRISHEQQEHVFLISINRPDKRNAFDSHMIQQLSQALTDYENDDNLRCAVIFAHGEHFTAGLDLLELQDKLNQGIFQFDDEHIDPWGITGRLRRKPVVVAIQGICFTAGIELMLNADVVIASEDCRFAQMEVQRGIMPFGGATVRFVQMAGWQKAMPYLLTGKPFDSQTAERLNLVSEVVATGKQLERALEVANEISQSAPLAVQSLLASAQEAKREGVATAFANLHGYLPALFHSKDAQEGVRSMLEKRPANFQGR